MVHDRERIRISLRLFAGQGFLARGGGSLVKAVIFETVEDIEIMHRLKIKKAFPPSEVERPRSL